MANVLGSLENLVKMGPDVVIQGLAGLIDGVGTGTEWSGEQVDRLGELEQQLADSIRQLRAQQGKAS
ncbi:MAG: hypothetical protein JWM18_3329 [Chloroflexi bacterium]|nr:hypothetical protein [Chloroflexota bacterium]